MNPRRSLKRIVTSSLRPSSSFASRSSSRTRSGEKNCSNCTRVRWAIDRAKFAADGRRQELHQLGFQGLDRPAMRRPLQDSPGRTESGEAGYLAHLGNGASRSRCVTANPWTQA